MNTAQCTCIGIWKSVEDTPNSLMDQRHCTPLIRKTRQNMSKLDMQMIWKRKWKGSMSVLMTISWSNSYFSWLSLNHMKIILTLHECSNLCVWCQFKGNSSLKILVEEISTISMQGTENLDLAKKVVRSAKPRHSGLPKWCHITLAMSKWCGITLTKKIRQFVNYLGPPSTCHSSK